MTRLLALLIILMMPLSIHADQHVSGTLEGVDLLVEDVYNEEGHDTGERYTAINRSDKNMRVSIQLKNSENIDNHLINYSIIIKPHQKADLGYVVQKNTEKTADWKYKWEVQEDIP